MDVEVDGAALEAGQKGSRMVEVGMQASVVVLAQVPESELVHRSEDVCFSNLLGGQVCALQHQLLRILMYCLQHLNVTYQP